MQYNKRDLPNALPPEDLDREVNKLGVPRFETVATTGIGVEETLKGITQLVLAHLIKKYGLEGSEPLDKEIQILNARAATEPAPADSLWDDTDDDPVAVSSAPAAAASQDDFELDDAADDDLPLVATELVGAAAPPPAASMASPFHDARSPFEEIDDFPSPSLPNLGELPMEVPMASIEIPLPQGILDSLPVLDAKMSSSAAAVAPPPPAAAAPTERRASDGLVKEVSIPLNLSLDELRQHRRLRLKITLDVNLLP
jgi:hypothetical protein